MFHMNLGYALGTWSSWIDCPQPTHYPPQSDPLKETLDGVLPLVEEGAEALGTVPTSVPQSIEEVRPCFVLRYPLACVSRGFFTRGAARGLPVH